MGFVPMLSQVRALSLALIVWAAFITPFSPARSEAPGGGKTIVFVCQHGVVNSQMAAAYFNRIAKERGLPFAAVSRGIDLYKSIPVRIQDSLALDGLEPANAPAALTAAEAEHARRVLAFDVIPADQMGQASVTYWAGVPVGIVDYQATRDEIARRVDELIPTLTKASN